MNDLQQIRETAHKMQNLVKRQKDTNSNIISANNDPTNSLAGGNKRTTLAWIRPTAEIGEKKVRKWPKIDLTYVKIHSTKLHTYLNVWRSADTGQREKTWRTKQPNPKPTIYSLIAMHAKLHTHLAKITNYLFIDCQWHKKNNNLQWTESELTFHYLTESWNSPTSLTVPPPKP